MCTHLTLLLFADSSTRRPWREVTSEAPATRPEKGGLVRIVGYFYPEALDAAAEQKRISRAEVLRRALRAYLDLRL